MKRNEFLQSLGVVGLGSMLPKQAGAINTGKKMPFLPPNCFLAPAVAQGPFYFNTNLIRQEIAEDKPGIPVRYDFTVVDINCNPIPNAVVDIWQCDKDGIYSAYSSQGTLGQTFLRGALLTDANGQCSFTAIYPGWYNGRLTHLHGKVRFNNNTYITTNFFYPDEVNQAVYQDAAYTKGQNPNTVANDIELQGDDARFNALLMTFSGDNTNGWVGSYTIGINTTVSAVNEVSPETGGQFVLHQNFPNHFSEVTTIKFSLLQSSRVDFTLFDLNGRLVAKLIDDERIGAGEHFVDVHKNSNGVHLAAGNYVYQISVRNIAGQFKQSKVLTVQ